MVNLLETIKSTASKAVSGLIEAETPVETIYRGRDRSCGYQAYLDLLRLGAEAEWGLESQFSPFKCQFFGPDL